MSGRLPFERAVKVMRFVIAAAAGFLIVTVGVAIYLLITRGP